MVVPPLILDEVLFFLGKGSNGLYDMSLYLRLSKKVFENFEYPCSKSWARPAGAPEAETPAGPVPQEPLKPALSLAGLHNLRSAALQQLPPFSSLSR